jgi:predicted DNA-binding transcriptional regulator AlpA
VSHNLAALIAEVEKAIAKVAPQEAPALIGELRRLEATVEAKMISALAANGQPEGPAGPAEDRLLDIRTAAAKLGMSRDWLYRHKNLPFRVPVGRQLKFSERGIERWIKQRQGR